MSRTKHRCTGCIYWRTLGKGEDRGISNHACHYFLDTGRTRFSMGAWGECTVRKERVNGRKRVRKAITLPKRGQERSVSQR